MDRDTGVRGEVDHGRDLIFMAMHAAGRDQAHHMQGALLGLFYGCAKCGIVPETAVLDGEGEPGEFLPNDAAGAEMHVSDLGIAHLPGGQTHVGARCGEQGSGRVAPPTVPVGRLRGMNRVVPRRRAITPAVEHNE